MSYSKQRREFLRLTMFFMCLCTVDETVLAPALAPALALLVFRTTLTRQWHARGETDRAGLPDLFLTNQRRLEAERRSASANDRRSRQWTLMVYPCLIHVSSNNYCAPGGNVLKRSCRLKKRHTHVFSGLQGNWKSHAALSHYYRKPKLSSKGGV